MTDYQRYGLSEADWGYVNDRAGGLCEVCQVRPHKHLDHDRQTLLARGLVCQPCNRALDLVDKGKRPPTEREAIYLGREQIGKGHRSDPLRPMRVSDDLWRRALAVAKGRDESLSQVIRAALVRYVKRHG